MKKNEKNEKKMKKNEKIPKYDARMWLKSDFPAVRQTATHLPKSSSSTSCSAVSPIKAELSLILIAISNVRRISVLIFLMQTLT